MVFVAPLLAKFPAGSARQKRRTPFAGCGLRPSLLGSLSPLWLLRKRRGGPRRVHLLFRSRRGWFRVSSSEAQTNTHTPFRSERVKLSCQCQTVVRHLNPIFHGALKPLSNCRRGGGWRQGLFVEYNDHILDTKGG